MPNGNPFLFNADKTILELSNAKKLLWERNGEDARQGITIDLSQIDGSVNDYRLLCLVTSNALAYDGEFFFLPQQTHTFDLTNIEVRRNQESTSFTRNMFFRSAQYSYQNNGETAELIISSCVLVKETWNNSGEVNMEYLPQSVLHYLSPYRIWGIM